MGLWYSKDSGFELIAYSDADLAGCNDDCKSTSGGIQFMGDKLVSWSSKKQDCTTMSTAEAEYVSLSACRAQVIGVRTQLLDYGFRYNKIPMYCDLQSAIAISCNPVQHSHTKHINIRYHFIKEHVEKGTIELYFVRTEYQLADLFTKALPKERRCNDYVVLQSIPCSLECKIAGKILLDHPLSHALTATVDVPVVYLQQFGRTVCNVPNTEDTIKFMLDTEEFTYTVDMIGYQGVVDKVSAFYMKNLAQPWQTMFKVFNRYLTTRTSRHDQTKINILQLFHAVINRTNVDYAALLLWDFINNVFQKKESIQYPPFIKLIIADLMKKLPNISQRIDEDYLSIEDDIPLVIVYTTGNYETVFVVVGVPMNQPQLVVSTQGSHRSIPRAHRTPTVSTASPQGKKRKQIVIEGEKDDDDSEDRLEPGSHKENPTYVDDDDDEEKVDEKKDSEMGSLETRTEELQTPIPTPPRSPRTILSLDKNITKKLTDIVSLPTATTSKTSHSKRRISSKYNHLPGALRRMCRRQGYMIQNTKQKCVTTKYFWKTHKKVDRVLHENVPQLAERDIDDLIENNLKPSIAATIIEDRDAFRPAVPDLEVLKRKFEKSSTSNTSCRDDDIHSQRHDDHQGDDAPPEGEKRVKRHKASKSSKSVEETFIEEDEVIPEDETPELITELQNVDKHVLTIFDRTRIKATLNDMLSNQFKNAEEPQRNPNEPPMYLYNKDLFFLKNRNTEEKKYILSLHKIHAERFPKADLEEKMNRWVCKEFKNFNEDVRLSIQHWKDSWHKRMYKKNQRRVRNNPEDYFPNHRITEVARITTNQPHGLDFMEQIIMIRENDK
ncbi:hypothetical protein Tco_0848061 [Tanacetum coccineum]